MTVYVFTGPTISVEEGRSILDAVYLPPVAQGDVYRVTLKQPQAIGIIDGYFERVPAVWHKEILWAMSQGVHVYGSASIGALRAAELASFGMIGVGSIFKAYHNCELEDDDEVAVLHGPAENNYVSFSTAMVNIRRTLAYAEAANIISSEVHTSLEYIAKSLFYPERSYVAMLRIGAEQGLPMAELASLRNWLPHGQVDQKREDARSMLHVMREHLGTNPDRKFVQYSFEYTEAWDYARRFSGELHFSSGTSADTLFLDRLLDEIRLQGKAVYKSIRQGAMARFLALDEAWRQGVVVTADMLQETTNRFRLARELIEPKDVDEWLEQHHLTHDQFIHLMEEEAQLRWIEPLSELEVVSNLPNYLRATNEYDRIVARARDKQCLLEARGLQNPELTSAGINEDALLHWYFEERLGYPLARDISEYAQSVGFEDVNMFIHAVLREFCYLKKG
jgi:hypothetical protein